MRRGDWLKFNLLVLYIFKLIARRESTVRVNQHKACVVVLEKTRPFRSSELKILGKL